MLNDLNFQFYVFKIPMNSRVTVSLGGGGCLSEPKRFFFEYSPS